MNKTNTIDAHIGKKLRIQRTMKGLSQQDLAKAMGLTFQQIQKYEKGANGMNANRLYKLAQIMHVPVEYFFDEFQENGASLDKEDARDDSAISDRELLEMIKAYKRIKEPVVRKRLSDLMRSFI